MDLVLYPDPVLKKRASPLAEITPEVRQRVERMFEIMYREKGVGLAGPQVAWSRRLFVMNPVGPQDRSAERVYINPRLAARTGPEEVDEEGCLSIPDVRGKVARASAVSVEAEDLDGQVVREDLEGLAARVFQHELDHLDGILFISRLSASEKMQTRKVLKRLEREYRRRVPAARR